MNEPDDNFLVTSEGRYDLTPPTEGRHAKPDPEIAFREAVANMRRFQKMYGATGSVTLLVKKEAAEAAVDAELE